MSGKESRSAKKTPTAVSERRYMCLLLGILISSTVLWWIVMFWEPNNVTERFFHSRVANGAEVNTSAVVNDNTSAHLVTKHSRGIELLAKMGEPEVEVMDLPAGTTEIREFKCLGWRATKNCNPDGGRNTKSDLNCSSLVPENASGYCEIEDTRSHERFRVMKRTCSKIKGGAVLRCSDAPGFANFRAEAQISVAQTQVAGFSLPNVGAKLQNPTRGIVMVVYPALVASAYATIRLLRDVLDCTLPIEIWYSPDEMRKTPGSIKPLQMLGLSNHTGHITFREIDTKGYPIRFEAKIYAIYNSGFEHVLFMDADNVPVRDPSFLFETHEFVKMGAVFWPDYWHPRNTMFYINPDSLIWQLLDMPFVDMFEQESGQLLIDRRRHAAPLQLAIFYAFHRPNYFSLQRLAWGDKDLFRFSWLKLDAPFFMIQTPPAVAGVVIGSIFCGLTMVQHGVNGEVLFLHRNQRKLMGKLHPKIVEAKQKGVLLEGLEALPHDGYPDPEIWTHLLSFRNTSARSEYIMYGENYLPGFPTWQRCYGRRDLDKSPYFEAQKFTDLGFGGIEKHLRQFAFESVQLQQGAIPSN